MMAGQTTTYKACRYCGSEASMLSEPRKDRFPYRMGADDVEEDTVIERRGYVARVATVYLHESIAYCNRCNRLLGAGDLVGKHAPRYGTAQPNNRTNEGR